MWLALGIRDRPAIQKTRSALRRTAVVVTGMLVASLVVAAPAAAAEPSVTGHVGAADGSPAVRGTVTVKGPTGIKKAGHSRSTPARAPVGSGRKTKPARRPAAEP